MTLLQTIATFLLLALIGAMAGAAAYYLDPYRQPRQQPMSPMEMYLAGGGDLSKNPQVAELLRLAEENYHGVSTDEY